jgi:hypothetical protein
MAEAQIDVSHHCGDDAGPDSGVVAVHQAARSSCCGEVLAEGGTPETGFSCTGCGQPCERVLGDLTAHWTCLCGTRRSQVLTVPTDVEG